MNTNGNSEADLLHIARASHLYYPGSIKTGLTQKNNPEFKLTSISKANNIEHENKHSAESDCLATMLTARLIKKRLSFVEFFFFNNQQNGCFIIT